MPSVIPQVSSPSAVGQNRAYTFTVQWANLGLNDAPAPLLTVGNTVPFGLAPSVYSLGTRYTFLGLNTHGGPPGILRPWQSELMIFHAFRGLGTSTYTAFADRVGKNASDPMDWDRVRANLSSEDLARTNFNALWGQFSNQIGGTWGDYLNVLARNATLLPAGMGNNRSPGDLERLEWQKALAVQTLSISGRVASDSELVEVGNVAVVAVPRDGGDSGVAWSLTDGEFLLPDMATGVYSLEARSSQGKLQVPATADTRGGSSATDIVLHLRDGAALEILGTDAAGHPVSGTVITVGQATKPVAVVVSDASGNARAAGLPAGV